jgi:formamidopyrimidine-DNA glycosylase
MTGKYFINEIKKNEEIPSLIFHFENGEKLIYCDSRKFGVFYVRNSENFLTSYPYNKIGADLVDEKIEIKDFLSYLKKINLPIKQVLLNQDNISGIGNIYASEILFFSKINPNKIAKNITQEEAEKIIKFSVEILKEAIELKGTTVFDFFSPEGEGEYQKKLHVYMREGRDCLVCLKKIRKTLINGRGSYFCEFCQPVN